MCVWWPYNTHMNTHSGEKVWKHVSAFDSLAKHMVTSYIGDINAHMWLVSKCIWSPGQVQEKKRTVSRKCATTL